MMVIVRLSPGSSTRYLYLLKCHLCINRSFYAVSADDEHIIWFWEVLNEMNPGSRSAFLNFAWARTRLPSSVDAFSMPMKIHSPKSSAVVKDPDNWLPTSQTCFFSICLPKYTNKEALREKLMYAIKNSPTMDADVRVVGGSGAADWFTE